jgi:hypothetical protein
MTSIGPDWVAKSKLSLDWTPGERREQAALCRRRIPERIAKRTKTCAGLTYAVDQVKKLPGRAAKPVELSHDDDIAGFKPGLKLRELRAIRARTADFLTEDHASAGSLERVKPPVEWTRPGAHVRGKDRLESFDCNCSVKA